MIVEGSNLELASIYLSQLYSVEANGSKIN